MTNPQTHYDQDEPDEVDEERQQAIEDAASEAVERGNEDMRNRGEW